jgi:hypothetical protein
MDCAPKFNGVTPQRSRRRKRKALANELDLRLAFRRITLTSKVVKQKINLGGLDPERLSRELQRLRKDGFMDSFANSQSPLEEEYRMQQNISTSPTTARWSSQQLSEERLRLGLPRFATVEEAQRAREDAYSQMGKK